MVSVVDDIRRDINADMGVRQFRVYAVTRNNVDFPSFDTVLEIEPPPLVKPYKTNLMLEPCGIDEAGRIAVTEVSLTYTEAELTGFGLGEGKDFYIRIDDAQGQLIEQTYWRHAKRPYPDRHNANPEWHLELEPASTPVGG